MIDESSDISSIGHVVVFGTFVEEGLPLSVFLDLFDVPNGKKDVGLIFEDLQKRIKEWGLDVEKCVSFGSDGCSTMVDHLTGVSIKILNPSNMPSKRVGLNSWGVADLEVFLNHYVVEKEISGKTLPLLVNSDECRENFLILNYKEPSIVVIKHSKMFGL